ncbi:MAG: HisA/HisF-related TIM barrel protein [Thermoproteota archaeon]
MRVIPSIDIMFSKRVEVTKHAVDRTFEDSDPVETAKLWEEKGASMIHLVDIDAALGTGRRNTEVIKRIISSLKIPVQVAGGIRNRLQVKDFASAGASRIVVRLRPLSKDDAEEFRGMDKIVLGMDYMGEGMLRDVGTEGVKIDESEIIQWVEGLLQKISLKGVLLTDIGAEGLLKGLRDETLRLISLLKKTGLELMYAGGVSSPQDIHFLKELGVDGVIVGKALYTGMLSFEELRRVAEE